MILANQTQLKSLTVANLAAGGVIGTAVTTVDIGSSFIINQTTTGQTITLPTPTVATDVRTVQVTNSGTASFSIYSILISAGNSATFIWTTTAWVLDNLFLAPFNTYTGTTTLLGNPESALVTNVSATPYTITLATPAVGNNLNTISITKTDVNNNPIVISGSLIALTLGSQGDSVLLRSNGTSWIPIAGYITGAGVVGILPWTASTSYEIGQLVTQGGGRVLQKIATGSSGATFDATEAALWTLIQTAPITTWTATTYYYANELVVNGGRTLRVIANFTSAATFTVAEAANWAYISQATPLAWLLTTVYVTNEQALLNGQLYARTSTGTSGATLNDVEFATWTELVDYTTVYLQNKTASYTLLLVDDTITVDTTAGITTLTFPTSPSVNKRYAIQFKAGTNNLILAGGGANTVQNYGTGAYASTVTYSSTTYLNATFTYYWNGVAWTLS